MTDLKIAVLQCEPVTEGAQGAFRELDAHAAMAADKGADILVTPEMYLTGYNIGVDAVRSAARPVDGAYRNRLSGIAERHGIALVSGYPIATEDGAIHNAIQLIAADGELLMTYAKTHLYGAVDRAQFSAGNTLAPVVEYKGNTLGFAICFDIEFPEVARLLAVRGADIILVPTANMLPYESVATRLVPARAEENGCYIAYANYCGSEDPFDYCGLSCIVAPDGNDLARAEDRKEILFADCKREEIERVRALTPYLEERRAPLYGALTQGQEQ